MRVTSRRQSLVTSYTTVMVSISYNHGYCDTHVSEILQPPNILLGLSCLAYIGKEMYTLSCSNLMA